MGGLSTRLNPRPCTEAERGSIARQFEWSNMELAPHIGLLFKDARDVEDQYRDPKEQRIALLEKWSQTFGREATLGKLEEGFKTISRNDIVHYIRNMQRATLKTIVVTVYGILFVVGALLAIGSYFAVNQLWGPSNTTNISNPSDPHHYTADCRLDIHRMEQIPWNITHCEAGGAWNDLPSGLKLFVGRKRNVTFIVKALQIEDTAQIININGAPGFGKSALAIHVGHQLIARCIQVRYIDTTEHYWFRSRGPQSDTTTETSDVRQTNIQPRKQSDICLHTDSESIPQSKQAIKLSGLVNWARSVEHSTVLILDNCDEVLHSTLRDDFLETIKAISQISHGNVKIIVTSQEKLLLQDNFAPLEVREMDHTESKELLSQMAQGISTHDAVELADEVGGSPLALRIVGQMINSSGLEFVPTILDKLKTNPLEPLDKVSDRKSKFRVLMDTACSYLDNATQEAAQLLSYFPGSFDDRAKELALFHFYKSTQNTVETIVTHSLLEEYFLYNDHRYKMHRLIREFFRERDEDSKTKWLAFHNSFCSYFATLVLNYTALYVSQYINEADERKLLTESHNIKYFSEIILQDKYELGSDELKFMKAYSELVMPFSRSLDLYSKHIIRQIFLWAVSENTIDFLCKSFTDSNCASYYNVILEKGHEALCDRNYDEEEGYQFNESCELLQCNVTNMTASVCQRFNSNVCTQVLSQHNLCEYWTILNYADKLSVVILILSLVMFWKRKSIPFYTKFSIFIAYIMCLAICVYAHGKSELLVNVPRILLYVTMWLMDDSKHSCMATLSVGIMSLVSLGYMYYNG